MARVPTMLSRQERAFYQWVTGTWARGVGAVVDLGCFAGGSSARLAHGMATANGTTRLHAFDRFTADENAKKRWLYPAGIAPFEGNDMYAIAKEFLSPWADRIRFHRGDITRIGWDGTPIEVLVVDAAKSAETTDAISADFYPSLIPGRSLLIHQDCLHWRQPWLLHQMAQLAPVLRPVCQVRDDTVAYLCTAPVTSEHVINARVADAQDADLMDTVLREKAATDRPWVRNRLERMAHGIRVNPGIRTAWKMMPPV